jgi:hypothetical protein
MSTTAPPNRTDEQREPPHIALLSRDLLVYAVLALLVWLAREISLMKLFRPGDDVGYWLGVAGASMMLLLFSYPIRKHLRFAFNWGPVKLWLVVHMCLGVGGPILILVHSQFELGSLNAAVAFYSMIIVALSGVIGRYIYARVNRGLYGERVGLKELKERAGLEQEGARSRLAFAPEVEQHLLAFSQRELDAPPGWRTHLRRVYVLPLQQWWLYWRCTRMLKDPMLRISVRRQWTPEDLAERRRLAHKLVRRYLNAVVRVNQFSAYEWMLSAWHLAHVPFVFLLVISTFIHIFAVHAY